MKYLLILISFLGFIGLVDNSDKKGIKYPIAEIDQSLLKNANSVVRTDEQVYEVLNRSSASSTHRYAITILKKAGIEDSYFSVPYSKLSSLKVTSAILYDADGKEVKEFKKDDIIDLKMSSAGTLFDDNRVKSIDPNVMEPPFTVEYEYEMDHKNLLFYPTWTAIGNYNQSIESAQITVVVPDHLPLRYHEINIPNKVIQNTAGDNLNYTWKVENFEAIEPEPYGDVFKAKAPIVYMAPGIFEFGGYKGDASSWNQLGKFINDLNEGRGELAPETVQTIQKLTKDATDDFEKIKIIYEYMQDKVRYVNIAVGIGGWQPFPAETVDRLSYGDCKGLSNYMKSMLSSVGIDANYTLVRAGREKSEIPSEFSGSWFNHAFLHVPLEKDTVWLECTTQTDPCGYMGTFTDDRDVLIITEEGGKMIKSPTLTAEDNQLVQVADIKMLNDGSAQVNLKRSGGGMFYDYSSGVLNESKDIQKKYLRYTIEIPDYSINDFSFSEHRSRQPRIDENIDLTVRNIGSKIGSRILVPFNILSGESDIPRVKDDRYSDVEIKRSYTQIDTLHFDFSDIAEIDKVPEGTSIASKYGSFENEITKDGNTITYVRHMVMNKGVYDKSEFADFVGFLESAAEAESTKFVVKKIIRP